MWSTNASFLCHVFMPTWKFANGDIWRQGTCWTHHHLHQSSCPSLCFINVNQFTQRKFEMMYIYIDIVTTVTTHVRIIAIIVQALKIGLRVFIEIRIFLAPSLRWHLAIRLDTMFQTKELPAPQTLPRYAEKVCSLSDGRKTHVTFCTNHCTRLYSWWEDCLQGNKYTVCNMLKSKVRQEMLFE